MLLKVITFTATEILQTMHEGPCSPLCLYKGNESEHLLLSWLPECFRSIPLCPAEGKESLTGYGWQFSQKVEACQDKAIGCRSWLAVASTVAGTSDQPCHCQLFLSPCPPFVSAERIKMKLHTFLMTTLSTYRKHFSSSVCFTVIND